MSASTDGFGGDDVPATLILARRTRQAGLAVVASNAPEIGPGAGWRRRFNLGGAVDVLFHAVAGGRIAATVAGVPVVAPVLMALDGLTVVPPAGQPGGSVWDVPEGWYGLWLSPAGRAAGVADVTIAVPGEAVAMGPPGPPSPTLTFGPQQVAWNDTLELIGNAAPGARFGLDWRKMPLDSAAMPVRIGQPTGGASAVPLLAGPGTLTALEFGGNAVPVRYDRASGTALLPETDHLREVSLRWALPEAEPAVPTPEPEGVRPVLHDGAALHTDLAEGATASFTLDVAAGGLFRVETLGRLHTAGAIGTHFVPSLAAGEANGIGQNMLLQGWLRAGSYHLDVTARDSAGHTGIVARPAPLLTSLALQAGGVARATLPAGSGLLVPIDIAVPGTYRIDVLGQGRVFEARLEDEGGWPLAASAPLDTTTQMLGRGRYRLLLMPQATDARAVIRLTQIVASPKLAGHGPFALPFGAEQANTWREPAARGAVRAADTWRFRLAAPADVDLRISDGMDAVLLAADGRQAAHLVGGAPFHGRLAAGAWQVDATSQGRNDRLDYTIGLEAAQLQPGVPRTVTLPGKVSFALAADRVVGLTTFGGTPVSAVMRSAEGRVIGRYGARADDWNVAVSSLLPAGSYTLELASAVPPDQRPVPRNVNDAAPAAAAQAEAGGDGDADPPDADAMQASPPQNDAPADAGAGDGAGETARAASTEITLALPDEAAPEALGDQPLTLAGGLVHHLALPQPEAGQLVLAGAASAVPLAASLERQGGDRRWRSVAAAEGRAPFLAVPADRLAGAWRLSVWPVDSGAPQPIHAACRLAGLAASAGSPRLTPLPLPGVADTLVVAHVALDDQSVLALSGGRPDVLAGAWPGHAAGVPEAGLIVPQSPDIWLIASRPARVGLSKVAASAKLVLTLAQGEIAALPVQAGALTAWIAEAQGQPGFAVPAGIAEGSAMAVVSSEAAPALRVSGGEDRLRIAARAVMLAAAQAVTLHGSLSANLAPATAAEVVLDPALHSLRLDLAAGTGAVVGWQGPDATTVWAGQDATSRTLQGHWARLLLVNTGAAPAPVALAQDALAEADSIRPDRAFRRFFGSAGALDLPVSASAGHTLVVAGPATGVFTAPGGDVQRGTRLRLAGAGRVTLSHGAGLVAAWLEGEGAAPWPQPAPSHLGLPGTLALAGPAMRLVAAAPGPSLLRIRSTAPLLLGLAGETPSLYPAGAAFSRYVPGGEASLLAVSAGDGPLSGSLEASAAPVRTAGEGLAEAVAIAPGDSVLFGFTLAAAARVGIGVQAQPDRVGLTLLDAKGASLATGAAMLRDLPAGQYVVQAAVPEDAPTTLVRLAIVGLVARPDGPPEDVVATYKALAGLTAGARR